MGPLLSAQPKEIRTTGNSTQLADAQEAFFLSQKTQSCEFRVEQLRKIKNALQMHQESIYQALYLDLGKSRREAYVTEVSTVNREIDYFLKNLKKLTRRRRVATPIFLQPARSYIYPEPLGRVLIISPWNFPFLLTLIPLIGAIAGGNCVVVKPSEISKHSSDLLQKILAECFSPEHVSLLQGGPGVSQDLLAQRWGHVFFTGSPEVGKIVARSCAEHLNPMTLELGGKSPVVVTKNANLTLAARRIIYGKGTNAGQTCVAPDYILAHADIRQQLIEQLKEQILLQYGTDASKNQEYGRIVNLAHFDRLVELQKSCKVIHGGQHNRNERFFELTLLDRPDPDAKISSQEIFGPLLPIIPYSTFPEMIQFILAKPKPLASYIFSDNESEIADFVTRISSGGGCINDTIVHPSNTNLKFGGIGASGIGSYHAYQSFRTFTHAKSMVQSSTSFDLPIRYLPAFPWKEKILRLVK